MACPIRDALMVAYFHAQTEQAKAATAMVKRKRTEEQHRTLTVKQTGPDKRNSALRKSATARMEVHAQKTDLEAHCREHGCGFIKSEDTGRKTARANPA